ncbi:MAG: molybdopterin dinucleotide binding domain-containing protein [Enterocloster clostridioformis]
MAVPSAYTLNSVFMDREDLSSGRGPMTLMLHPRDAAARKIADGSHVTAFNELARWSLPRKSRLWWQKERLRPGAFTTGPLQKTGFWSAPSTMNGCPI